MKRSDRVFLLTILLLAFFLRVPFLWEPIRGDEAFTFINFARLPFFLLVRQYFNTNNHLFHSMLVHLAYSAFGLSEISLRLTAFLSGMGAVYLVWRLATRLNAGTPVAAVASACCAAAHIFIYYSTFARGYTLQTVLALAAINIWLELSAGRLTRAGLTLGGALFLVLYTIPSGVIFVIPFCVFLLGTALRTKNVLLRKNAVAATAIAAALTLIAFLPLYHNFPALIVFNGQRTPLGAFLKSVLNLASEGVLPPFLFGLFALLGWAVAVKRFREYGILIYLTLYLPLAALFYWAKFPLMFFDRSYVVVFPLVYIFFAMGIETFWHLLGRVPLKIARRSAQALVAAVLIGFPAHAAYALLADRSALFYPALATDTAYRALITGIAPSLRPGDIVCGTNNEADTFAAIYTIADRGYGFYGLGSRWKERPPNKIYLLGKNQNEIAAYFGPLATQEPEYSPPSLVEQEPLAVLYQTRYQK